MSVAKGLWASGESTASAITKAKPVFHGYKSIQHSRFGIVMLASQHCYHWRFPPKMMEDSSFQRVAQPQPNPGWTNKWAQEQKPRAIVSRPNLAGLQRADFVSFTHFRSPEILRRFVLYRYIYIYSWFVGKANRIANKKIQQDKKNPKARTGCQETTNGPDGSSSTGTLEESQKDVEDSFEHV